jgi:hypothetical protein
VCNKAFARADLLKRHAANHDSDSTTKKRKIIGGDSPSAGRVSHACRACATARVKCEEMKPCGRCRNRNITCEFGGDGAGSTAAMHLLHLSGSHGQSPHGQITHGQSSHGQVNGNGPYERGERVHAGVPQPAYEQLQSPVHLQQNQGQTAGRDHQMVTPAIAVQGMFIFFIFYFRIS